MQYSLAILSIAAIAVALPQYPSVTVTTAFPSITDLPSTTIPVDGDASFTTGFPYPTESWASGISGFPDPTNGGIPDAPYETGSSIPSYDEVMEEVFEALGDVYALMSGSD